MNTLLLSPGNNLEKTPEAVVLDVIRIIDATPRVSQRKVATSLGVSVGKVNYVIRALVERGLVKAENYRGSRNKLGYLYVLTPAGLRAKAEMTKYFLSRKVKEYEALRLDIERLEEESRDDG